jgi:hypothetical protein
MNFAKTDVNDALLHAVEVTNLKMCLAKLPIPANPVQPFANGHHVAKILGSAAQISSRFRVIDDAITGGAR